MKTCLLIDDEQMMLNLLSLQLTPYGYNCIGFTDASEAIDFLKVEDASVVLLDVMMPGLDGWEACKEIRETSSVPIIMLTALGDKESVVKGLRNGADDFISKPFDTEELVARMEAVTRRNKKENEIISGVLLDEQQMTVTYKGTPITLTPKEFMLLASLIRNKNKIVTRDQLIEAAWGYSDFPTDRTVDSHMRNLREKLRVNGVKVEEYLKTVWGVGFKWVE